MCKTLAGQKSVQSLVLAYKKLDLMAHYSSLSAENTDIRGYLKLPGQITLLSLEAPKS